jgi:hypothetical protein
VKWSSERSSKAFATTTPYFAAVISARIDTAISAGVRLPIGIPTGPRRRASLVGAEAKVLAQALPAPGVVAARAERANVEGRRFQCFEQGQIVKLRIVRQGDDGQMRVGRHRLDDIVGHAVGQPGTRHTPFPAILLARVADRHRVVQRLRHFGQIARSLTGTDDEQAPGRTVHGAQEPAVPAHRFAACRVGLPCLAGRQIQRADDQPALRQLGLEFGERGNTRIGLDDQFQGSAAGQAEALRLVAGHPIDAR